MTITDQNTDADFRVADLTLASFGRKEIELAEHEMPGLMALRERFAASQPLEPQGRAGLRLEGRDARGVLVVHGAGSALARRKWGAWRPEHDPRRRW